MVQWVSVRDKSDNTLAWGGELMRVAKYNKVFHPDNNEQRKAFPRAAVNHIVGDPFRRDHPPRRHRVSIVDECRHLGPVVPDVPGPHPVQMAGTAHGIDHRLVQCVDIGEHLLEAPALGL